MPSCEHGSLAGQPVVAAAGSQSCASFPEHVGWHAELGGPPLSCTQQTVPGAQLAAPEHLSAAVSPPPGHVAVVTQVKTLPVPRSEMQHVSAGIEQVVAPHVMVVVSPPGRASGGSIPPSAGAGPGGAPSVVPPEVPDPEVPDPDVPDPEVPDPDVPDPDVPDVPVDASPPVSPMGEPSEPQAMTVPMTMMVSAAPRAKKLGLSNDSPPVRPGSPVLISVLPRAMAQASASSIGPLTCDRVRDHRAGRSRDQTPRCSSSMSSNLRSAHVFWANGRVSGRRGRRG
jgi:hypothetical protein